MSFNSDKWLELLVERIRKTFGNRVLYIGHTGSYARGEATENSDIDVNVVLDCLSINDLNVYRRIIQSMPYHKKACGFICGKNEMASWPPQELFQFTKGCKVYYGSLKGIIKEPTDYDIRDNIRNMVSAIYHETCHRFLYGAEPEVEAENLRMAYKASFYILQEWFYLKGHQYIPTKAELLPHLNNEGKLVLTTLIRWDSLKEDRRKHPQNYFEILKDWSSNMLQSVRERS